MNKIRIQLIFGLLFCTVAVFAQKARVKIGAYYFDGWTGTYSNHITPSLVSNFPEREPKWGWITSSQQAVKEQIEVASNAGLSFFSFCWYYGGGEYNKNQVLNNALGYYLNSPNNYKLDYCLLVANHSPFEIGPKDWSSVSTEWIKHFKRQNYMRVDGRPMLTFFSMTTLINNFGTPEAVRAAFDRLRADAANEGLNGINLAVCLTNVKEDLKKAEACGFDVITGYNYHGNGLSSSQTPIENMLTAETKIWNNIPTLTKLKYIPVSTLNWDPRPWAAPSNNYATAPYFVGFSAASVNRSVQNLINWLDKNPSSTVTERVAILYAWNENGEGAYLTPCKNGENMLEGVRKALLYQIPTSTKP